MELIEGKIYQCKDGQIRRLEKIESDYFYYSIPIDTTEYTITWMKLSKTVRHYIEDDFLNGLIINDSQIVSV